MSRKAEMVKALEDLIGECAETKKVVSDLENAVRTAQAEYERAKNDLRLLTERLQEAVRADAKATVKVLKAEARARLLGIVNAQR